MYNTDYAYNISSMNWIPRWFNVFARLDFRMRSPRPAGPNVRSPGPADVRWSDVRSPGPAGPKTKKSDMLFFISFHFFATCTKYGQTNSQQVIFRDFFVEKPHCRAKLGEKKCKISKNQIIYLDLIYFNIF